MAASNKEGSTSDRLPLHRRLLYGSIVAILSVVLFFGGLEGVLRLVGSGHATRFYHTEKAGDGTTLLRENRWFVAPWFSEELIRRPVPFRLPARKADNAYRIFVLGSSAAMGDPEASFSISRMLGLMLEEAYPEIHFEVVNAAITAINSHVVREIADDCARLEPDLYILYEGNNEVIGPFGPAGVFTPFLRSRAGINTVTTLRQSRTGQLLGDLAHRLGRDQETLEEWGGMRMFLEQQFPADDPALEDVRDRFRENLESIIASGQKAGARTLLCTVLTNQKDFPPFLSAHRPGLSALQLEQWQTFVDSGDTALAEGNNEAAERSYRAALKIDDRFAGLAFKLGRVLLAEEKYALAGEWLERAETLDTLRFRTDAALNSVIMEVGAAHRTSARLVDLRPLAAQAHPSGIPGDELLYEHVHLNFQGTYLVASELFDRVTAELVNAGRIQIVRTEPLEMRVARVELAYTIYEQAMIAREMLQRFQGAPFSAQLGAAERIARWQDRVLAADARLAQPESLAALKQIYQYALNRRPHDWMLARNYGMALVAMGRPEEALPWLRQAEAFIDDDADTLFALATALGETGQSNQAALVFERVRALEPRYPGLPAN